MCLKDQLTCIERKVAIHDGSEYKSFVVVPTNFQIDFEAQGSIFMINE
jgi:hypothetical protein